MIQKYIPLDEGLMIMDEVMVKAREIIEGFPETKFSTEEFLRFYDCVYFMCNHRSASDEITLQIYEKFRNSLIESIFSTVLPTLIDKQGANLLRGFVVLWSNYKLMARWLCRFFECVDRYCILQVNEQVSLNDISISCFRDLVFEKLYRRFIEAALTLINQEREGLQIDCLLLKNVLDIFEEISDYRGVNYYEDFEKIMLVEISGYYSRLASEWLLHDSLAEYVQKVFWCLNRENQRARQYLNPHTKAKILQVVKYQLLHQNANKLMEKKQAENSGQVTDYQDRGKCFNVTGKWLSKLLACSVHIR